MEVCERGEFWQLMGGVVVHEDKDDLKEKVFRACMFGRVSRHPTWKTWDAWQAFSGAFPDVARHIKNLHGLAGTHRITSILCQRVESFLMIEGVVGELLRDHPFLPLAPIHDAIGCRLDDLPLVEAKIYEVFVRVGLQPFLKRK